MSKPQIRSHAAHSTGSNAESNEEGEPTESPSALLSADSTSAQALLEKLDDVIYAAVSGDPTALAEARKLWPRVVAELGWQLVEESREQYLRYAIDIAQRKSQSDIRQPEKSLAALEIVSLLTKGIY